MRVVSPRYFLRFVLYQAFTRQSQRPFDSDDEYLIPEAATRAL